MKDKNELKIISEYLKLAHDPAEFSTKYSRRGAALYAVGWLCIFSSTLGYLHSYDEVIYISLVGFCGGGSIATGVWFKQMAWQAKIISIYLSKDLLVKRVHELSE